MVRKICQLLLSDRRGMVAPPSPSLCLVLERRPTTEKLVAEKLFRLLRKIEKKLVGGRVGICPLLAVRALIALST